MSIEIQRQVRAGRHTCGEAAATAQENLDSRYRVHVVVVDANALKRKIHMVELRLGIVDELVTTSVCRQSSVRDAAW